VYLAPTSKEAEAMGENSVLKMKKPSVGRSA
jgi:hypothetical protein